MATATTIPQQALEQAALNWPDRAKKLIVQDQQTYEHAGAALRIIKTLRGEIGNSFDPIIQKAHQAHKEALSQKKLLEDPLSRAEKTIKVSMAGWIEEQRRIEREEQRRREEQARKEAEEKLLREAEAAEKAGASAQQVNTILESKIEVAPQSKVESRVQSVFGISAAELWRAEVVDLKALLKAILDGEAPEGYVSPNMSLLNARAEADKSQMNVPGVKAVSHASIRASR